MSRMEFVSALPLTIALAMPAVVAAQDHVHPAGEKLGTVHVLTSCTEAAQPTFDRAASLLHSFEFGPAITAFESSLEADPSCAMAQWGIALSRWGNPFGVGQRSAEQVRQGFAAVDRARAIGAKTDRERAYVEAVSQLYTDPAQRPQQQRVEAYRDAMGALTRAYPDDTEAAIFYALSLTAAEDLNDKTYASRLKAVAILEPLFARYPDHPGLAHYIIHSYDVPALAGKALDAAKRYADIAPSAPHALHMPSHTFTRVGLWQESIDTNIASADAAKKAGATAEELHASDYQMYAYLQSGQDAPAKALLTTLPGISARFNGTSAGAAPPAAAYYAMAAIPARWALEHGAWKEAAALQVHTSPLPYADALTEFARAIGAARSGDVAGARTAIAGLDALRARQASMNEPYWTQQIQIQIQTASAWLAFAEKRTAEAIAQMRQATEAEDRTEKAAVTPGPLAPAREMLGEMLLESKDSRGALKEFEATLAKEPNRFRSLAGAAQAATAAGDTATASRYYALLVKISPRASDPLRPELRQARASVSR